MGGGRAPYEFFFIASLSRACLFNGDFSSVDGGKRSSQLVRQRVLRLLKKLLLCNQLRGVSYRAEDKEPIFSVFLSQQCYGSSSSEKSLPVECICAFFSSALFTYSRVYALFPFIVNVVELCKSVGKGISCLEPCF